MMRILQVHNFYQRAGGEDRVFANEGRLLESHGHRVERFTVHNDSIRQMGRLQLFGATLWNRNMQEQIGRVIRATRPAVVHFHNTFPLISPAAYRAARAEGVAVVQTLHNFRLLCANALLFRDGQVCQKCLGKGVPLPGVVHACYRNSRCASAVVTLTLATHRLLGTWTNLVDLYIIPSESARKKFLEGGLPPEKLVVKPHFVDPDPLPGPGQGGYAVFVGRLSEEKGVDTLLAAWERLEGRLPLRIIGDGPLRRPLEKSCRSAGVEFLGPREPAEVYDILGQAAFLVYPSRCYETFGCAAVEAFAKGTPVVASRLGAMADLIDHGRTGLLFAPGDAADLAQQIESLLSRPASLPRMRCAARQEYLSRYSGTRNYRELMDIYEQAIGLTQPHDQGLSADTGGVI